MLFAATGCADAIEGQWEGEDEVTCAGIPPSVEHVSVIVEGDGTGSGDVCNCQFTFTWQNLNEERYRFDIDFGDDCLFAADGEYDCRITNAGGLDCDQLGDYIKVD